MRHDDYPQIRLRLDPDDPDYAVVTRHESLLPEQAAVVLPLVARAFSAIRDVAANGISAGVVAGHLAEVSGFSESQLMRFLFPSLPTDVQSRSRAQVDSMTRAEEGETAYVRFWRRDLEMLPSDAGVALETMWEQFVYEGCPVEYAILPARVERRSDVDALGWRVLHSDAWVPIGYGDLIPGTVGAEVSADPDTWSLWTIHLEASGDAGEPGGRITLLVATDSLYEPPDVRTIQQRLPSLGSARFLGMSQGPDHFRFLQAWQIPEEDKPEKESGDGRNPV
ncbi:MAG: hypothetical protein E6R03_16385 [Hyphomicrobiaceae bacterium]|nr:MAG: hypothetical protein E6R03_16385 [Hyphomicrobiaceae bacterium]